MKLESLKKDKFEAFKDNEVSNAVKIAGGKVPVETSMRGSCDHYDYGTRNGSTDGGGTAWDFYYY